jgi:Leucine-rich repeat (LRR) protein
LDQLLLNENKILKIEGVENLTKLSILDLSDNLVKEITGLSSLVKLEELWLTNNKIELFAELENLRELKSLKTIYLERCPIYFYPDYKIHILSVCPWVTQVDALQVNRS